MILRGCRQLIAACWCVVKLMMEIDVFAVKKLDGCLLKTFMTPRAAEHGFGCSNGVNKSLCMIPLTFFWLRRGIWHQLHCHDFGYPHDTLFFFCFHSQYTAVVYVICSFCCLVISLRIMSHQYWYLLWTILEYLSFGGDDSHENFSMKTFQARRQTLSSWHFRTGRVRQFFPCIRGELLWRRPLLCRTLQKRFTAYADRAHVVVFDHVLTSRLGPTPVSKTKITGHIREEYCQIVIDTLQSRLLNKISLLETSKAQSFAYGLSDGLRLCTVFIIRR